LTWIVFLYMLRGNRSALTQFLLLAVMLCDLYAFHWSFQNRLHEQTANADHLAEMQSLRPVADFLKSQPGLFRVHNDPSFSPSGIGGVYGVQTTFGASVTMLDDYWRAQSSPNSRCLLNERFTLAAGASRSQPPAFASGQWHVYAIPASCPRAWVVQQAVIESADEVRRRVEHDPLDLLRVAYLSEPLASPLDAVVPSPAAITFGSYAANRIELRAQASATGLLVLSELYYPGWQATLNGQPAHIYKVNNILRGVIVSPGSNHLVMEYRPASIRLGAILSLLAFFGTFLFAAVVLWRSRRTNRQI